MGSSVVTFTGNAVFAAISDTSKITVGANSTVTLDGNLAISGSSKKYIVNSVAAGGQFVVTGDIIATSDYTGSEIFGCKVPGTGYIVAKGLRCNATGSEESPFRLSTDANGTVYWGIGSDGLGGSAKFWVLQDSSRFAYVRADADFSITTAFGSRSVLTFDTTGADGNAHTVTICNGGYISNSDGTINVTGKGRILLDAGNTFTGAVNVKGSATLAMNAGKRMTDGSISVFSNAMLQVAQSGTNTVNDLTLVDGAILGFNFTQRRVTPVLALASGKTATIGSTVYVKASMPGSDWPSSGEHILTSGFDFTGKTVALADGAQSWVRSVSVDDLGNIVFDVKPAGSMFIFR